MSEDESTQQALINAVLARRSAARELADCDIDASPADVSAWIAATPRERRELMRQYAVLAADDAYGHQLEVEMIAGAMLAREDNE
jgi:hypothetical protein